MRHVLAELFCKSGFPSGLSADIPVSAELMMVNIDLIRAACDRSISRTPSGAPAAEIIAADLRTPVKRAFRGIATKQSAPLRFSWHLDAEAESEAKAESSELREEKPEAPAPDADDHDDVVPAPSALTIRQVRDRQQLAAVGRKSLQQIGAFISTFRRSAAAWRVRFGLPTAPPDLHAFSVLPADILASVADRAMEIWHALRTIVVAVRKSSAAGGPSGLDLLEMLDDANLDSSVAAHVRALGQQKQSKAPVEQQLQQLLGVLLLGPPMAQLITEVVVDNHHHTSGSLNEQLLHAASSVVISRDGQLLLTNLPPLVTVLENCAVSSEVINYAAALGTIMQGVSAARNISFRFDEDSWTRIMLGTTSP
jgi:hypothetical protein